MSGWLIQNNTVIDAQMGIMVGGGRDTIVEGNNFIGCDKGLHIDNRGEKQNALGMFLKGHDVPRQATTSCSMVTLLFCKLQEALGQGWAAKSQAVLARTWLG